MPWVTDPIKCSHPARPTPQNRDEGRIWQCSDCNARFKVVIVDFGHDVQRGELPSAAGWRGAE